MGWFEFEGQRHALHAEQALLLPAHRPHLYSADPKDPWSIHWVHFAGREGDYFARLPPEETTALNVDAQCMARAESIFQECYSALVDGFILPRMIHVAKLIHHLLAELFYNNKAFSVGMRTGYFHDLNPTLNFLHQNLHRSVSLAEMARQAGLSISHFSYIFKEQTDHSPVDYFIYLKIQHACNLLALSSLPIKEISQTVGYSDCYYFSRIFKKVMGMSPTAYRCRAQRMRARGWASNVGGSEQVDSCDWANPCSRSCEQSRRMDLERLHPLLLTSKVIP